MGTTLTGTTPQDTYDSLIKVTDNGPISGTLKALSDGLGNDSTLSLSTTAASIAGTLAVSGASTLADATVTSVSARNSGVPAFQAFRNLDVTVVGSAGQGLEFGARDGVTYKAGAAIYGGLDNPSTAGDMTFQTRTADALTSKMSITSAGNVGIGTTAPAFVTGGGGLHINTGGTDTRLHLTNTTTGALFSDGFDLALVDNDIYYDSKEATGKHIFYTAGSEKVRIQTAGGISFNGDTAAANALDDYEEGTWTMGVSFGGASVGVTTDSNIGTYTKIGRQVMVSGLIQLTSKGSSTGSAKITGLPFTIASSTGNYSAASLRLTNINFTNQFQGFGVINATTIALEEVTILGVNTDLTNADFANNSAVIVSLTYFV